MNRRPRPSRRELLAAAALLPLSGGVFARAAALAAAPAPGPSAAPGSERILVVLELVGGNDGLNTVVPYADDDYHRARPVLAIPGAKVRRLDGTTGLHPALDGLHGLWDQAQLAILRGVGPTEPTRSHFRSREIWHTARLEDPAPSRGWLGRIAGDLGPGGLPLARLGERETTLALAGAPGAVPALASLDDLRLLEGPAGPDLDLLCGSAAGRSGAAAVIAAVMADARRVAAELSSVDVATALPGVNTRLGRALGLAATLIGARLGSRVLYVSHGGYDTHARQQADQYRNLRELGDALAAFQAALARQGDAPRVATMVFSEFGRRIAENAGGGTDHGAAGPVLLIGPSVRGGLHGERPALTGPADHDVPVTLDFRRVYAEVLRWLDVDPRIALGDDLEPLRLLGGPTGR